MNRKRITIYDIAKELGMSASYVSKALNDHPLVNEKIIEKVKEKATELNYRHNSQAANLRRGSSKTMGVIIPHIAQHFFSEVIAGIEEACTENQYSLIMCQSHDSYHQERKAIDVLVRQNVDCILICIAEETRSTQHLEAVKNSDIEIIQFDRCLDKVDTYKVMNDNSDAALAVVQHLVEEKYKKIAFIGGPEHLLTFRNRKTGFIKGMKEAALTIPSNYMVENALSKEATIKAASELLKLKHPPDAFVTVSDVQALTILQLAESLGIAVPQQLGIIGFANESFTELVRPTLSSVDQQSRELGRQAANVYFNNMRKDKKKLHKDKTIVVKSSIVIRQSSRKKMATVSKASLRQLSQKA